MRLLVAILGVVLALPGAMVAVHYTTLMVASLFYRERRAAGAPHLRFLVLIPAHNEERVLGRTLSAAASAMRPGDLMLVVDDRSADRTSEVARAHGAHVLRREPGEEPGRSAARRDGIRHALSLEWDAIALIDADSIVEPGYFAACEAAFACGAQALQARSEAATAGGPVAQATVAAFALDSVTVPRGRDRLGLSVRLKGTGMVLRRHLAERYRFRGPGAGEDLWFSDDLCLDGILPRHVDSARLRSESAASIRSASGQRVRWETGRLLAAREFLLPLVRRRDAASLEAAWHLLTPPFALALFSLALGAGVLAAVRAWAGALAVLLLLVLLLVDLLVAMVQARVPLKTWLALAVGPAYVLWKVWIQARAVSTVLSRDRNFAPTPRE